MPASEEAPDKLIVPAKLTGPEDPDEHDGTGKKAKTDLPKRFALGRKINTGPPENAGYWFTVSDFGRIDGQLFPPRFKTTMLDEQRKAFTSTLSDSVIALPRATLTDADWQMTTNMAYRITSADLHKVLLALGCDPDGHRHQ